MEIVKKKGKIILSAILLVLVSLLVYSGANIFKTKNKIEPEKFNVFNPVVNGDDAIDGTSHITFDTFFLSDEDGDGEAEGYHGAEILNGNSEKLYFELNISGDVTLKNGKITFVNDNVEVSGTVPRSSLFNKAIYSDNFRSLDLQDVGNGVSSFYSLNVKPTVDTDLTKFNGTNKVILTGTVYDAATGEETPITKEVTYNVNAYTQNISYYYEDVEVTANTADRILLYYKIKTTEGYNEMPLDETHLEAVVSKLAGQDPINVFVSTSSEYNDDVEYTYDAGTRTLSAVKKATVENNQITKKAYTYVRNKRRVSEWHVYVEYQYDASIKNEISSLSTTIWAKGIKNAQGDTEESARKTNVLSTMVTALTQGQGDFLDNSEVRLGDIVYDIDNNSNSYYFIDKSNIISAYEGESPEDIIFPQQWHLDMLTASETTSSTIMKDKGIVGGGRDLSNYVTYDSVIVRPNSYYNKNRALTIYNDETNEVLFVVNSDNYYTQLSFPNNVHKIRVETNQVSEQTHLDYYFNFERRIHTDDIVNDIDENDFNVGNLKNTIDVWASYQMNNVSGETGKLPHDGNATFNDQLSFVRIDTDKQTYSRAVSAQTIPMKLTLSTNYEGPAYKKWEQGIFLVKVPSLILGTKNVDVYSNEFDIVSTDKLTIGNDNFIRVQFKAKSIVNNIIVNGGTTGSIYVEFDAVVSPKQTDDVATFELYGKNLTNTRYQSAVQDIYDIDENFNDTEYISKHTKQVHVSIPSEVITGASITDYDSFDSTVVSPLVANVNPLRGSSDATMNLFLINYSNNDIDNVYFIGKTGFIGNTYQVGDGDLGTTFDSYMDGPIVYDSSLNGVVTVYYSDQETPSNDLSDLTNNWTQSPADYHDVKSYMIVFDSDYGINVGEEVDFSYPIELPTNTLALNKISYYTHGAYFNYLTGDGSYTSNASSGKLGVRMARTYGLHVQLYKKYANYTPILSGDFKLTNVNEPEDSRIIHISRGGFADLEGLIVNDEYEITQISADESAVIDPEVRSFRVINDSNDELVLQDSGNFRRIEMDSNLVLQVELENDVWYQTYFHTYDYDTGDPVRAAYKVTGKNYEDGVRFSLDDNGSYLLKNLAPNEVYKVEQIYVDGYVKTKSFEFKVVRDLDDHSFDVTTRQAPTITRSGDCDSDVTTTTNGYGYRVNINKVYPSTEKDIKCNISLNLAGYKDKYELTGSAYLYDDFVNGNSTLDISLSSNMDYTTAPSFLRLEKDPTYAYYYAGSIDNIYQSFDVTTATTMRLGSPVTVDFKGGSDYNFYINYHRSNVNISSSQNPYAYVERIKLTHLDGDKDELYQNKTKQRVQSSDNTSVYQTIHNDNASAFGNPTLQLDIESRTVIKKTLELQKVDATSGDPLAGAMFKISGPGVPDGQVLSTDSEGKASINLNLSFSGSYYSVPGVGDNSEYPLNNVYTIQEILAPDGYTINNQKVNFMMIADYDYNGNPTYKVVYTTNNRYSSATATDQGVFTLGIEDYPLFKITKTDIETGEVLPNTYYSIYRIDPVTSEETFAKNIYGDIVGEPTTIDGVEYYIVKTNENGELTLALNAGTYKLVEVQAADEKYDITDQVTYFSIGESAEYKAKGTTLENLKVIDPKSEGKRISRFTYTTNDGGTLVVEPTIDQYDVYSNFELVKYDSDFNEVWRTTLKQENNFSPVAEYFDRPGVKYYINDDYEVANDDPQVKTIIITEEEDSYYVFFGVLQDFRIDKQSGQVLYNNTAHPLTRMRWYYTSICDKEDGIDYSDYLLIPGDDEHVYCNSFESTNVNARFYDNIEPYLFDSNSSGTIQAFVMSKYNNSHNVIELSDGTFVKNENYDYNRLYLIKGDKNGRFTEAFDTTEKINAALTDYFASKGLNAEGGVKFSTMNYTGRYSSKIKYFDDGSIVMVLNQASIYYDNSTRTISFAVRFDPAGNVVYAVPLGFDGNTVSYNNPVSSELYGGGGVYTFFNINDDGSFDVPYRNSYENNYTPSSWDSPLYTTENLEHNFHLSQFQIDHHAWGWSNCMMLHYDADGKQVGRVLLLNNMNPDLQFGYDGFIFNSVFNIAETITSVNRVEDGYVVAMSYSKSAFASNGYNELSSLVLLKNGESYYLSNPGDGTNYVIFKVDDDSRVEWVKEYQSMGESDWGTEALMSNLNGEYITFAMINDEKQLKDVYSEDYMTAKDSNLDSYITLARFKVSNEVIPEAPASVSLDLTNSRKQYKINLESNDDSAGTFTIQSGTNPEYVGPAPGEIETVKFGDSSISDITITPFAGYNIKGITVNGKAIVYQSDLSGVVHLNRFDDVRENKNIYVEFEESEARVLVHHYLQNTTISIAPDETITGRIGAKYYTVPQESGTYALATDAEDNAIFPDNYQGTFTVAPIEVTYYYVPVVSLEVNYLDQDSYAKLADTITSRAPQGTSYRTTAKSIRSFSLAGVLGDPDGTMDDDLTEVSYLYNRNTTPQSKVTTRFVEEGTDNDIVPPVEDFYDVGLTYNTVPLTNPPAPYVYASMAGSDSGTVGTEDITVIYYYRKQTGRVITEYRDDITNEIIAQSVEQTIVYGETYTTSPLTNIPNGYTLSRTPDNASDVVNTATVYVIYLYHKDPVIVPDTGTVTARYLDISNNKAVANPITKTYNYGETYTTSRLTTPPTLYEFVRVEGEETGIVNTPETIVTYWYKVVEPVTPTPSEEEKKEEEVPNPKTNDNVMTYVIILGASLVLLSGFAIYKKRKNK